MAAFSIVGTLMSLAFSLASCSQSKECHMQQVHTGNTLPHVSQFAFTSAEQVAPKQPPCLIVVVGFATFQQGRCAYSYTYTHSSMYTKVYTLKCALSQSWRGVSCEHKCYMQETLLHVAYTCDLANLMQTGTLTENRMTVVEGWFAGRKYNQVPQPGDLPAGFFDMFQANLAINSSVRTCASAGMPTWLAMTS